MLRINHLTNYLLRSTRKTEKAPGIPDSCSPSLWFNLGLSPVAGRFAWKTMTPNLKVHKTERLCSLVFVSLSRLCFFAAPLNFERAGR